jgi:DNA-nicking Smr family endonuclease
MPPATPEETLSDHEQDLFLEECRDVRPLPQDRIDPWRRRRPPRPLGFEPPERADERERELYSPSEIHTGDELAFRRPGVQDRLFQELRRGHLEVQSELDLHGLTTRLARDILEQFLRHCRHHDIRCVRVIHGKGFGSEGQQPVLKQFVERWLRQREEVLAFCSATSRDGGTGAAYLLLRSARKGQGPADRPRQGRRR